MDRAAPTYSSYPSWLHRWSRAKDLGCYFHSTFLLSTSYLYFRLELKSQCLTVTYCHIWTCHLARIVPYLGLEFDPGQAAVVSKALTQVPLKVLSSLWIWNSVWPHTRNLPVTLYSEMLLLHNWILDKFLWVPGTWVELDWEVKAGLVEPTDRLQAKAEAVSHNLSTNFRNKLVVSPKSPEEWQLIFLHCLFLSGHCPRAEFMKWRPKSHVLPIRSSLPLEELKQRPPNFGPII